MKQIIAIQGNKFSGKTTTAKMLQFLLNTPKWLHNYTLYRLMKKSYYKFENYQILAYADKIKQMLSILLNVPVIQFEDRDFKENCYVDFTTLTLHWRHNIGDDSKLLNDSEFSKEVQWLDQKLIREKYLSIRQVMQYYGTEVMRRYFGQNIWILSTMKTGFNKIIISDQRFLNENEISKQSNAKIIHIIRPEAKSGNHSSESELQKLLDNKMYNYLIDNNGNLKDLFNKCKEIVWQA